MNRARAGSRRGFLRCRCAASAPNDAKRANAGSSRSWSSQRRIAVRCLLRLGARETEAFDADDAAHAPGPQSGVAQHDVATHAVPDQRRGLAWAEDVEQAIEIRKVIGEPVAVGCPRRAPEAAPVRRCARPAGRQLVDQELERCAVIHPAVQQYERWPRGPRGRAPARQVVVEPAHLMTLGLRVRAAARRRRSRSRAAQLRNMR